MYSGLEVRRRPERQRTLTGAIAVLAIGVLLAIFYSKIEAAYYSLFAFREHDSFVFYALFVALLVAGCLTSILPASILGVFAGAFFGIGEGFLISAGSFMFAALLAFGFARYFFRAFSRRLVGRFIDLERLERNLARSGWKYALLLRLSPIAPFGITSYGLGLTPISWRHYILTTFGTFPFLLACVYVGKASGMIVGSHGEFDRALLWQLVILFTVGSGLIAVALWFLPRLAKRA
jgi:uncharacterized membrane protein YdjX (TVP38/TMEM64 family)